MKKTRTRTPSSIPAAMTLAMSSILTRKYEVRLSDQGMYIRWVCSTVPEGVGSGPDFFSQQAVNSTAAASSRSSLRIICRCGV